MQDSLSRTAQWSVAVGPTGAGKTTCYRTLANVLTALRDNNSTHLLYQRVQYHVLNPKCITLGELYGEFNELTQVRCFSIPSDGHIG